MQTVGLRVLAGIAASFLALALWWGGMAAASAALGLPPGAISQWSVTGWLGYGLLAISLNAIILELLERPTAEGGAAGGTI